MGLNRHMPRMAGHKQGVETVRGVMCLHRTRVTYLTLFAFSSENWRRPTDEILPDVTLWVLEQEIVKLHEMARFKVIGDLSKFEPKIIEFIQWRAINCQKYTSNVYYCG